MKIGLRIDVDTFRGTKLGVPRLCEILADHSIKATYFFSVGPDNMGRHLWRLLRPAFLIKMLRSHAASLYGWDIIFKGTFWPGPLIGAQLGPVIKAAAQAGHEAGLHAWDHHAWQARIDGKNMEFVKQSLKKGFDALTGILGGPPVCSAVPGWKCNDTVLKEKAEFPFSHNSDCRGDSIFMPVVEGKELSQPQIPVTLPTYDEVVGRNGISNRNYNEYMISLLRPEKLNVLTVHAESEGIACSDMFAGFVKLARAKGASFMSLGRLLAESGRAGRGTLVAKEIPGREGWVACQYV